MLNKRLLFLLIVLFTCTGNYAQKNYAAGFTDTVIYAAQNTYTGESYEGPAPLFVQIWFPDTLHNTRKLRLGELVNIHVPDTLSGTYSSLRYFHRYNTLEYALRYQLGSFEPIDYRGISEDEVYGYFEEIESESHRSELPGTLDSDVIVYHHGTLGNPGENARMAEFFAQRGYIFISASFHLPHKDIPFGWESFLNDLILEREVMKFAKQMSGDRNVFFIGHSWGAQLGWCLLHEEGLADGFVSMETTLEFKTDSAEVSDKWPHMLRLHYDSDVKYEIPVLALASAREIEPMPFFRSLDCYDLTEVIFPYSFDHEAFTSQYLMRGEIGHDIPVPDRSAIAESQIVYDQMLELILQFFKSIQHNEQKDAQTQSSQKRAVRMMNLKGDVISK